MKYIPQGAIGDQEEMAQLDGEQVLCCGHEASASFAGEQWGERGNTAVHPQQEQLADPDVQPAGRDPGHLNAGSSQCADGAAPAAAGHASPIPMTDLFHNPYPNPYPDETTVETQLDSTDPERPLV